MPLGEKLFEEAGKITGMSVKPVTADGVTLEGSYVSQIQGIGRFPSGMNMGTTTIIQGPKTARETGQGVFMTKDGESAPWHLVATGKGTKMVNLVTIHTSTPKIAWMNDLLILIEGTSAADLSTFNDVG